ncbi:MAG: ATP-binding protein [Veillonella sp.]|nr:ATP-binding protein [Veillonella sp.]
MQVGDTVLIDFAFKNIRSFKDQVTFSMEVGEGITDYMENNTAISGDIEVVKSSFIFGGNASGKTNVIRAFQLLRDIIVHGTSSELESLPIDTFENEVGNTYFKIRFIKNGNLYSYELNYDAHNINEERLVMNDNIIFNRTVDNIFMPSSIKSLKVVLRANQPLLYFAQSNNVSEAKVAYEWFAQDILVLSLRNTDLCNQELFKLLYTNPNLKDNVLYFLQAADFHIKDIKIQESFIPIQENNQNLESRLFLQFEYECKDKGRFTIDYQAESISIRIFLFLATMILDNYHNSKLFLIDDFDCFLHPKLVTMLLRIFNEWNDIGTQLIATTHNTNILDAPVRTDQVWFVDKSYYGVSTLDSAFDYNELSIKGIKKNYQDGLYGADQIINDSMIKDILLC